MRNTSQRTQRRPVKKQGREVQAPLILRKTSKARNRVAYTPENLDQLSELALVRLPTILANTGMGRSTFLQGVKEGRYPQPVKLGPRQTCWRAGEIRQLLKQFSENAG